MQGFCRRTGLGKARMRSRDPLENPGPLIRRLYSYVAYRVDQPMDAEDITADVLLRAVRYRSTFDPAKGRPLTWLLGIARRVLAEYAADRARLPVVGGADDEACHIEAPGDVAEDAVRRIRVGQALRSIPARDRELLALRFGADLKAREIAEILDMDTHAVEVALGRAIARIRPRLADDRHSL
jgi:RNA polymerase sigma factor (sigma-70 family)